MTEFLSLGADVNYMEVMLTCTERFIIDAVSWQKKLWMFHDIYITDVYPINNSYEYY